MTSVLNSNENNYIIIFHKYNMIMFMFGVKKTCSYLVYACPSYCQQIEVINGDRLKVFLEYID